MGKDKEKSESSTAVEGKTYEERVEAVNLISQPLASKKSTKRAHKLVKKASSAKIIRRGVKEVVKGIRKNEKGICILAGDIYPIDVISHLPVLLEENGIPYLFVPSKQELGAAACTKRPTSVVLVRDPNVAKSKKEFDGMELYNNLMDEAKAYEPS